MTGIALRRLAAALFAAVALAAPAAAQNTSKLINMPAEKYLVAPGGVDMRTGRYAHNETDLTGGGGQGALVLTRIMPEAVGFHANPFGNFSHNWDIFLVLTPSLAPGDDTLRANVHYGGRSLTFESRGSAETFGYAFKSDGALASLTYTGSRAAGTAIHRMTAPDGTVMIFRPVGGEDCADQAWGSGRRRCAFVSEMTEPDGTHYAFDYVAVGGAGNRARLARVTSSRGYALLFELSGGVVAKACLFNLASAPAPAPGSPCPLSALATSSYSYGNIAAYPYARLVSAIPAGGRASTFTYTATAGGTAMGFVKPGEETPWLTNTVGLMNDEEGGYQEITTAQAFADGQTYSYVYGQAPITNDQNQAPFPTAAQNPNIAGGSYKDSEGRETLVRFDFPVLQSSVWAGHCTSPPCEVDPPWDGFMNWVYQQTPGPVEIKDPLMRRTLIDHCDPAVANGCAVTRMQSSTDPEGIRTQYEYDGRGNISKATTYPKPGILNADGTAPQPIVVEAAYDISNPKAQTKPLWTRDANGNVTHFTYSADHGGLLTETGPAVNGVTPQKRFAYIQRVAVTSAGQAAGPPVWLLDRMSFCRTGNPGPNNAGCALGAGDEVVTSYDYGPAGGPNILLLRGQAVTADGATLRTCFAYDSQGRKISETSPNANLGSCPASPPAAALLHTTSTRYDPDGRVTGTIGRDPDGDLLNLPAMRNSYDQAGRLVKAEQGVLHSWQAESVAPAAWAGFTIFRTVETQYDALDRKVREAVKGSDGATYGVTDYSYDRRGLARCTAVRMNPGEFALPAYDACLQRGTDAARVPDRITQNFHDAAGQLVEAWDGVGTSLARREALYTYDGDGRKTSLTDARGFRAEMGYDGHGRQSRWLFPSRWSAGLADVNDFESYVYDSNGNRTKLRKRDGSILIYQYDAANRMSVKIVPERSDLTPAQTRDVYYLYDNRGLQIRARFDAFNGEGVTTDYDGFGRAVSSALSLNGTFRTLTSHYDKEGNRTALVHPDGAAFGYYRDLAGRLATLYQNGLGHTDDYIVRYGYRPEGMLHWATRGFAPAGFSTIYAYDPVQRPASIVNDLPVGGADLTVGLAYNPAGQIGELSRDNDAYAWRGSVAVDRDYETDGQNRYLQTVSGGVPTAGFSYDANGNLASDQYRYYRYDVENRLVSATNGAALVYDPLGRLFEVSGPSTGTTRLLYDGDELVAEYNGSGTPLRRYVHGTGADDPVAVYEGPALGTANRRYMLPDQQGSIVGLVNADGSPSVINTYDEYGIPGAANQGRFQYTGQAWLPELGMYYYKARIYSPTLGRFLQVDPIGYADQINLYAYVGNDPLNNIDPTGKLGDIYPAQKPDRNAFREMADFFGADVARAAKSPSATNIAIAAITLTPFGKVISRVFGGIRVLQAAEAFGPAAAKALWSAARPAVQGLRQGGGRVFASGAVAAGSKGHFRYAAAYAEKYGGAASDYQKVTTSTIATTAEGAKIEVHAVRNSVTGKLYDIRYKVQGGGKQ